MAAKNASFGAVAVKDRWTATVALTWAGADTATVTIAGQDLVVTIGGNTTTAQVATTIKEAWESATFTDLTASCIPQGGGTVSGPISAYTATVSGSTVIFTADVAGKPQTISVASSTAGDGTFTIAHTTTGTGPTDWGNVDNWAEGAVPVNTNDVTIDLPGSFDTGLDQSAVTLNSLTLGPRFNGRIGLKIQNTDNSSYPYPENRATELAIGCTTVTNNSACTLVKINQAAVPFACTSNSTGTSAESGRPAFQIRGTDTGNVFSVYGGDNGFASNNETAVVATINQDGGAIDVGTGTTLTTHSKLAGTATIRCAVTTASSASGSFTQSNGNVTTATISGGSASFNGTGSLTTLNVSSTTALTVAPTRGTISTLVKISGTASIYTTVTTATNTAGSLLMTTGNITTLTNSGEFRHIGATTVGTLNQNGGTVNLTHASSAVTVLVKTSGSCTIAGSCATSTNLLGPLTIGSGNITATTNYSGNFTYEGTSTITAATIYGGAADIRTGDITLLTVYDGAAVVSRAGTLATLRLSGGDVKVLASATAVTSVDKSGGTLDSFVAVGTLVNEGGNATLRTGNSTAITVVSGYVRYNGAGTLTAVTLSNTSVFDVDGGTAAMTITTLTLSDNVEFKNVTGRAAVTNYVIPAGKLKLQAA